MTRREYTALTDLAIDATTKQVRCRRFDNRLFNSGNGLAEARHVFIAGNALPSRLARLFSDQQRSHFVIAETGFGAGLNFLAAWDCWRDAARHRAKTADDISTKSLTYYAIERFPLSYPALSACYASDNPVPDLAEALQQQYPDPVAGQFLLEFDGGRVKLILLFDDAISALDQLEHYPRAAASSTQPLPTNQQNCRLYPQAVDAWFLDNFAPANNPDTWQAELFARVARHSTCSTTLATFTVEHSVCEHLTTHGFNWQKHAALDHQRDMLTAQFTDIALKRGDELATPTPTKQRNRNRNHRACYAQKKAAPPPPRRALVIGAGIAGACIAQQLATSGWQVRVQDEQGITGGASGNARAVLYARNKNPQSPLGDFHESCCHYAGDFYRRLALSDSATVTDAIQLNGMLQLDGEAACHTPSPIAGELRSRRQVDAIEASSLAGIALDSGGMFYPQAGWLDPLAVCRLLLSHPAIHYETGTVNSLQAFTIDGGQTCWQALACTAINQEDDAGNETIDSDIVVIACGHLSANFSQTDWLPTRAIRGQTSLVPGLSTLSNLTMPLCQNGYVTPAIAAVTNKDKYSTHHCHVAGATFTLDNNQPTLNRRDHRKNLDHLRAMLPERSPLLEELAALEPHTLAGRVGFRSVTPDYLPLVGEVLDAKKFTDTYASLTKNAKQSLTSPAPLLDGLYLMTGFGSRGFTSAPLTAAILAASINAAPIPISEHFRQRIHPARFLLRKLIRGQ